MRISNTHKRQSDSAYNMIPMSTVTFTRGRHWTVVYAYSNASV